MAPGGQQQIIYIIDPSAAYGISSPQTVITSNTSGPLAPLSEEMKESQKESELRPTFSMKRGTTNRSLYSMGRDGQLDVTAYTGSATIAPKQTDRPSPKTILFSGYKEGMSLIYMSDLFRYNAKKSNDMDIQFEFAKWLIETANENEDALMRKDLVRLLLSVASSCLFSCAHNSLIYIVAAGGRVSMADKVV